MTPTADICDGYGDEVRVLEESFASYGGATSFSGPISTLAVFEDNSKVRDALEEAGSGRVLVIAGGGSTRCAWWGETSASWPTTTDGPESSWMVASVTSGNCAARRLGSVPGEPALDGA